MSSSSSAHHRPKPKHLPDTLKTLIRQPAPHPYAQSGPGEAALQAVFEDVHKRTAQKGLDDQVYLTIMTGILTILNLPTALPILYTHLTSRSPSPSNPSELSHEGSLAFKVFVAGYMREVGVRCVSFIGIPRVINCLAALRKVVDGDEEVAKHLPTENRRNMNAENLKDVQKRGRALWDDIYEPHSEKLLASLGRSHPDFPSHILQSHYSPLLSIPPTPNPTPTTTINPITPYLDLNRTLASLLAVVALRAQGGVDRQVEGHVWGLMKADKGDEVGVEDGVEVSEVEKGQRWLTTGEGCEWVLEVVDEVMGRIVGR